MNKYKEALEKLEAEYSPVNRAPTCVTEAIAVLHEPATWEPEPGDIFLACIEKTKRTFIGMDNGLYVYKAKDAHYYSTSVAIPIPERPWIKHDGTSWPECLPADRIEYSQSEGTYTDWAIAFNWGTNAEWRLAE